MRLERWIVIARDVLCVMVGLGGIVHQEATGKVSEALLLVYTTLVGVPGVIGIWQLKGAVGAGHTSADSQSRSQQQPSSPQEQSPSSSA